MRPGNFHPWYGGYQPPFIYYGARCRIFPRLFWFALGAGAFAFWSRHEREQRAIANGQYTGNHNKEWSHWSGHRFGCHRHRELQQQQQQQQQAQEWHAAQQTFPAPPVVPAVVAASASAPSPTPVPVAAPTPTQSPAPVQDSGEWPAERIRDVGKQASDTMAEMSEHALDSLLANLQSLKAKIAEAREAREKREQQRVDYERRASPDKKDHPERLV